jgi:hypothetical protein
MMSDSSRTAVGKVFKKLSRDHPAMGSVVRASQEEPRRGLRRGNGEPVRRPDAVNRLRYGGYLDR